MGVSNPRSDDSHGAGTLAPAPSLQLAAALCRIMSNRPAALLDGVDPQDLHAFLGQCRISIYPRGKLLIDQGQCLDHAYLVIGGAAEIYVTDENGNSVLVHLAQAGEVIGEVELLSGRLTLASVLVRPGTAVARFDAAQLHRLMPPGHLVRNLARLLHARLARDDKVHLIALFYSSEDRIRGHLLHLTTPECPRTEVSQADLAAFTGCSRQTVNRVLAQLRQSGVIELGRGAVTVLDRARLAPISAPPHLQPGTPQKRGTKSDSD
ncbi:MAG: Crp/Fnr family transcriptional regulator [Paracoccus sp. (in: a-proteobacteria)]|nr:Crp/Fnr family transcriptional regulator [Paracoccus sp. (in: a-proteobacteria)]